MKMSKRVKKYLELKDRTSNAIQAKTRKVEYF